MTPYVISRILTINYKLYNCQSQFTIVQSFPDWTNLCILTFTTKLVPRPWWGYLSNAVQGCFPKLGQLDFFLVISALLNNSFQIQHVIIFMVADADFVTGCIYIYLTHLRWPLFTKEQNKQNITMTFIDKLIRYRTKYLILILEVTWIRVIT